MAKSLELMLKEFDEVMKDSNLLRNIFFIVSKILMV